MSEYDQWQIAAVLPEDFQEFDDWALQTPNLDFNGVYGGVIYHKHLSGRQVTLYMTKDGWCRNCQAKVPPGLIFLARAYRLGDIGDANAD